MKAPTSTTRTQAELKAELVERFGSNPMAWAFQCPTCGDSATIADFVAALEKNPDPERPNASDHVDNMPIVTETVQVGEAAQILGCNRKTVHRYIAEGRLTIHRRRAGARGAVLLLESQVKELASERRAELRRKLDAMGGAA